MSLSLGGNQAIAENITCEKAVRTNTIATSILLDSNGVLGSNNQVLTSNETVVLWQTPTQISTNYFRQLPGSDVNNVSGTILLENCFVGMNNARITFYFHRLNAVTEPNWNTVNVSLGSYPFATYTELFSNALTSYFTPYINSLVLLGNIGNFTGASVDTAELIEMDICNLNLADNFQIPTFQIRGNSYGHGPTGTLDLSQGQKTTIGAFTEVGIFTDLNLTFTPGSTNISNGFVTITVSSF